MSPSALPGGQVGPTGPAGPSTLVLLADTVLGSATTFDMTGIVGSYKHLLLLASLREDSGGAVASSGLIRFNGDSGNNYDDNFISLNNTTVTGTSHVAQAQIETLLAVGSAGTANRFGANVVNIIDYANTSRQKMLTCHATLIEATAANQFTRVGGGVWASTAAINRIQVFKTGLNYAVGSHVTLYGYN